MHNFIIQLSNKPIPQDECLDAEGINQGGDATFDYTEDVSEDARKKFIVSLVRDILPQGMFILNPDGESMTFRGGFTEWSREYVKRIHDTASIISTHNVFKWLGPKHSLEKLLIAPLDTDVYFCLDFGHGSGYAETSIGFMGLVSELEIGQKVYFGSVISYRY